MIRERSYNMENKLPVTQCQYCGSRDIGEGWQHGKALVTFRKRGFAISSADSAEPSSTNVSLSPRSINKQIEPAVQ